jgi:hypothetical protein
MQLKQVPYPGQPHNVQQRMPHYLHYVWTLKFQTIHQQCWVVEMYHHRMPNHVHKYLGIRARQFYSLVHRRGQQFVHCAFLIPGM